MIGLLRMVLFIAFATGAVIGAIRLLGLPFEFVSFGGGLMVAMIVGFLSFQFNNWWSSFARPYKPQTIKLETKETPAQIMIPSFIALTGCGLGFAILAFLVLIGMFMLGFRFTLLFWIAVPLVTFAITILGLLVIPKT
ncbi:MAG: hypothetical protein HZC40_24625 [Chloroflexi bacterium]|nr:hypothetical protein [Chloroflexota bacterium]